MTTSTYLSAFVVALLGGVHCAAMCGGITGVLTLGLPASARDRTLSLSPYLLAYNLGRILGYTVAGTLAGGLGAFAVAWPAVKQGQSILQLLAGLMMLLLGGYLAGWWRVLDRLEAAGAVFWRRLEPLGRRLLPVRSPPRALALGLVWGWLPCGLVYSVLVWALSAGSAGAGALLMLSFGLGTLPALLAMGFLAGALTRFTRHPLVRHLAGGLVCAVGLYQAWMGLLRLTATAPEHHHLGMLL